MGRQFTSCVMFHKLPRSGSVSLSVNEGGQTGWCLNSPIPIWFSRICFRVELMGTKKGPQEWSPENVRGALIPGARLPLTSHWGLSVQAGPWRWRPGPPHHCHRSTGGLPPPLLWLRISQTPLARSRSYQMSLGMGFPGRLIWRCQSSRGPQGPLRSLLPVWCEGWAQPEVQKH